MSDIEIHGHCDEKFQPFLRTFEKGFKDGKELGASFALSIDGELVIDVWAGFSDRAKTRPWQEDTLVFVASTSKIACALCGLMLVDRGLIDLDAPIAKYWPEFAGGGKGDIPVRYIFSHNTGVAGLDGKDNWSQFADWDWVISCIEKQEPWWEPGTQSGYHALTFGFMLGMLVRKTTGQTLPEFFQTEVCQKVKADFFLGLPDNAFARLAEVQTAEGETIGTLDMGAGPLSDKVMGTNPGQAERIATDPKFLKADNPAANGVSNARSLVKIGDILAGGGAAQGQRFLSAQTTSLAYQEQSYTHDLVINSPVRFGLGFGMASKEIPIPFEKAIHWGGIGGSSMVMIPERKAAVAYTPNKFYSGHGTDSRSDQYATPIMLELLKTK
jgi:CubicO group peptidase (beta-lactamase class C family)